MEPVTEFQVPKTLREAEERLKTALPKFQEAQRAYQEVKKQRFGKKRDAEEKAGYETHLSDLRHQFFEAQEEYIALKEWIPRMRSKANSFSKDQLLIQAVRMLHEYTDPTKLSSDDHELLMVLDYRIG